MRLVRTLLFVIATTCYSDHSFPDSYLIVDFGTEEALPHFIAIAPMLRWGKGANTHLRLVPVVDEWEHLPLENEINVLPVSPDKYLLLHLDYAEDPTVRGQSKYFRKNFIVTISPDTTHYLGGASTLKEIDKRFQLALLARLCQTIPVELLGSGFEILRYRKDPVSVSESCERVRVEPKKSEDEP